MAKLLFLDRMWFEKLGIMHISAMLKSKGHQCGISMGRYNDLLADIESFKPDLIGFSAMTVEMHFVKETAAKIKKSDIRIPIILGGVHATFFPEILKDENIDFVCIGEGEYAILELLKRIENREACYGIENIWFKENGKIVENDVKPLIEDLDKLPFPDRQIYIKKYNFFKRHSYYTSVMAIRGCPFGCNYCYNSKLKEIAKGKSKQYVRFRTVDNVITELEEIKRRQDPKHFLFHDGTFIIREDWILNFCHKYKEKVDIPFSCCIRADNITEDLIKVLKMAGCEIVRFGTESGSQRIRKEILNRNISEQQILTAASLIKKYKMKVYTFNMMGLPTETFKEACETIKLNQRIKADMMAFDLFIPFPKLDITDFALRKGFLCKDDFAKLDKSKYKIHKSILKQKEISSVTNLLKLYLPGVKLPWLFPFIKKIAKLPSNFIFVLIYNFSLAWEHYKNCRLSILQMWKVAIKNYKVFS